MSVGTNGRGRRASFRARRLRSDITGSDARSNLRLHKMLSFLRAFNLVKSSELPLFSLHLDIHGEEYKKLTFVHQFQLKQGSL